MRLSLKTLQMEGVFVKCQGSNTLLVTLPSMKSKSKVVKKEPCTRLLKPTFWKTPLPIIPYCCHFKMSMSIFSLLSIVVTCNDWLAIRDSKYKISHLVVTCKLLHMYALFYHQCMCMVEIKTITITRTYEFKLHIV